MSFKLLIKKIGIDRQFPHPFAGDDRHQCAILQCNARRVGKSDYVLKVHEISGGVYLLYDRGKDKSTL